MGSEHLRGRKKEYPVVVDLGRNEMLLPISTDGSAAGNLCRSLVSVRGERENPIVNEQSTLGGWCILMEPTGCETMIVT